MEYYVISHSLLYNFKNRVDGPYSLKEAKRRYVNRLRTRQYDIVSICEKHIGEYETYYQAIRVYKTKNYKVYECFEL